MKILIITTFIAALCLTSCTKEHDDNSVKEFFIHSRIGSEPDAALLKKSSISGNWDYIATFHGMIFPNDMDICQTVAKELHQKNPDTEYSCSVLN